jgi:hypothetical protein
MYIVSLSSSVQKRVVRKSQSSVNSASRKRNFLVHRQRGVNYASRRQDSDKCWSASRTSRFHKRFKLNFVSTSVLVPPPPLLTASLCLRHISSLHISSLPSPACLVSRPSRLCCRSRLPCDSSLLQVLSLARLVSAAGLVSYASRLWCKSHLPQVSFLLQVSSAAHLVSRHTLSPHLMDVVSAPRFVYPTPPTLLPSPPCLSLNS